MIRGIFLIFNISGMSGNSDLVLSFPVSASTYGDLTFLCSSYGEQVIIPF